jgi:outer membrane protein assembly factor BamB
VGSGGGLVLVGSIEGKVYAISAANGSVLWERQMETEVLTAPQSNGKIVVVQTIDDKIYALRSDNGEEIWRHDGDAPILSVRGTSSPLVTDNMVLAGFDSGKLVAFNTANGSLIWETRLALPKGRTELQRMVDIDGDPLLVGDVIYSASYQGRLGAITRGTGRQLWSQESSSHHTPAFVGDKVFVTEADDRIRAFESGSGRGVWMNEDLFLRRLTAPVIFGDSIAVADSFGYLHLLNMEDGRFIGRTKIDRSGIRAPMLVNADLLIVQANSGLVVSLRIEPR